MNTKLFFPCLLAAGLSLSSCLTKSDPAPTPGTTAQPYTVTGVVLDTRCQPLPNVKVRAENDALYGFAEVRTDAQGRYTMPKLEIGGYKIYAWQEVSYKGQTYYLRMGMPTAADYNAFSPSAEGTVKNFHWQLSGLIPDRPRADNSGSGYFGGTIRLVNMDANFASLPEGAEVTFTFTPVAGATLLDGSAPQPVQKTITLGSTAAVNYWVHDIPQCEYRITAQSRYQGATRPVALSRDITPPFASAIEGFYFKPSGNGGYENGLLTPQSDPIYLRWQ